MKLGEKLMFGFALLIAIAGVSKGVKQLTSEPAKAKNYYEWNETALKGHALYKSMGCNSCHRAMGSGEIGFSPVLDGEGTKRSKAWIDDYLRNPLALVPGSAHDGNPGPDFRLLEKPQRDLLSGFLVALKANPGSPSHPRPPPSLK